MYQEAVQETIESATYHLIDITVKTIPDIIRNIRHPINYYRERRFQATRLARALSSHSE